MTWCHSSAVMSATERKTPTPALFTSTSMPPNRRTTVSIACSTCCCCRTSARIGRTASPPATFSSSAAPARSVSSEVAVIATRAPRSSSARAIARPMPREPPVTTATLPVEDLHRLLQYTRRPAASQCRKREMTTVAIVGAGDMAGAAAQALASRDAVGRVLLVDANRRGGGQGARHPAVGRRRRLSHVARGHGRREPARRMRRVRHRGSLRRGAANGAATRGCRC